MQAFPRAIRPDFHRLETRYWLIKDNIRDWSRANVYLVFVSRAWLTPLLFLPVPLLNGGDEKSARWRYQAHLVGGIGLEPTTFAMSTQRSNQLS
jgi:hypothetical protein